MTEPHTIASLSQQLQGNAKLADSHLDLPLPECTIRIRSNHAPLIQQLANYFSDLPTTDSEVDIEVVAIERPPIEGHFSFTDWVREPEKSGRKDSYLDLHPDRARLLRKVRTGMLFLQSESQRIAAGPCVKNDNQVINFICSQYMTWLQQNGWLMCHAAGLEIAGHGVGIAGFSGGGKSTLMLNLLEHDAAHYLSNDRLFIRAENGAVRARGIPKLPRINPGTIVHNPRLQGLLSPQRREELLQLPTEALWSLEEKYDVLIGPTYGENRSCHETGLDTFVILNWKRDSTEPSQINEIDIEQRPDLLMALMKSPGPFYQNADGQFERKQRGFDEPRYLNALKGVTVYEVSGGVNFDSIEQALYRLIGV